VHTALEGVLNTAAPNPVNNKSLMQLLRNNMNIKIGLPMPRWLLKMGAVLIKTETELILKSRWVIPARLLEAGFQFKYPNLDAALKNILNEQQQNAIQ
jgi:NAD dependent epimerase/dehydratase family enzyme